MTAVSGDERGRLHETIGRQAEALDFADEQDRAWSAMADEILLYSGEASNLTDEGRREAAVRHVRCLEAWAGQHVPERSRRLEEALRLVAAAVPLGRPATPQECAFIAATARNALAVEAPAAGDGEVDPWLPFGALVAKPEAGP